MEFHAASRNRIWRAAGTDAGGDGWGDSGFEGGGGAGGFGNGAAGNGCLHETEARHWLTGLWRPDCAFLEKILLYGWRKCDTLK